MSTIRVVGQTCDKHDGLMISPPETFERVPLDLCCVIDSSGSMGEIIPNDEFEVTPLRLVKHAMVTIARTLEANDRLSIVEFADEAEIAIPWTFMDTDGRDRVEKMLLSMEPGGCTEMKDGMLLAQELTSQIQRKSFRHVILLTDGQPTTHPAEGFKSYARSLFAGDSTVTLHTIGFGQSIVVPILRDMASVTGGMFSFISDVQMLGTVFVHLISNLMSMVATRIRVNEKEVGGLIHGRPRFLLNDQNDCTVSYETGDGRQKTTVKTLMIAPAIADAVVRNQMIWACSRGQGAIRTLAQELQQSKMSPFTMSLAADLEGEVDLAFEKSNWRRWGEAYVAAFCDAHAKQICTNFKDGSLQAYDTETTQQYVDKGSLIFRTIPSVMLKKKREDGTVITIATPLQSTFYSTSNPCFLGSCLVQLSNGTEKPVNELHKGDKIRNADGGVSTVLCMVQSTTTNNLYVDASGLTITGWHPILSDGVWTFPRDKYNQMTRSREPIYSILLQNEAKASALHHTAIVNGVTVACLAHGIAGDVIGHPFWGTSQVVDVLQLAPTWSDGFVCVHSCVRDSEGQVIGLIFD